MVQVRRRLHGHPGPSPCRSPTLRVCQRPVLRRRRRPTVAPLIGVSVLDSYRCASGAVVPLATSPVTSAVKVGDGFSSTFVILMVTVAAGSELRRRRSHVAVTVTTHSQSLRHLRRHRWLHKYRYPYTVVAGPHPPASRSSRSSWSLSGRSSVDLELARTSRLVCTLQHVEWSALGSMSSVAVTRAPTVMPFLPSLTSLVTVVDENSGASLLDRVTFWVTG